MYIILKPRITYYYSKVIHLVKNIIRGYMKILEYIIIFYT